MRRDRGTASQRDDYVYARRRSRRDGVSLDNRSTGDKVSDIAVTDDHGSYPTKVREEGTKRH